MRMISSLVPICFGLVALGACVDSSTPSSAEETVETDDVTTSTIESSLVSFETAGECIQDGGCTTWDITNGCTRVTCCTACSDGRWACNEFLSLGSEECVFFPRPR